MKMQTIFEKSVPGRRTTGLAPEAALHRANELVPGELTRAQAVRLPECSELDVVRHFTQLAKLNYSVDANFYPLGSCTMKYNPKVTEVVAAAVSWQICRRNVFSKSQSDPET